jgi:predicted metal-dependent hydrolase
MDEACLSQFLKGVRLFNLEEFYDCHDIIEDIWLQESSDQQPFLQGIIQAAVAFHHYQHGKWGASRSMLKLAIGKLENYPKMYQSVKVEKLVCELRAWKSALDEAITSQSTDVPIGLAYPQISQG